MRVNIEKNGAQCASEFDKRLTKVGRIIRKSRITELPQLISIINAEMRLIGRRPEHEINKILEKKYLIIGFIYNFKPDLSG